MAWLNFRQQFFALQPAEYPGRREKRRFFADFLTACRNGSAIDLESAAFVFHMNAVT
jgi:hypothetical protein